MRKVVAKKNLQYEEPRRSFPSAEKQKSRREEANSSSKRSAKRQSKLREDSNFSGKGISKNNPSDENAVAQK